MNQWPMPGPAARSWHFVCVFCGSQHGRRVEKNWGFLEHKGELHILYNTLPCTAVYRYDLAAPSAASLVSEQCYENIKLVRCKMLEAPGLVWQLHHGKPLPARSCVCVCVCVCAHTQLFEC